MAAKSKKPTSPAQLQPLLKPTADQLEKIAKLRDQNRSSPHFHHLSAVSEGAPALGWVAVVRPNARMGEVKAIHDSPPPPPRGSRLLLVDRSPSPPFVSLPPSPPPPKEPKPAPFVGDMKDASQFYANRILKEFKDK